MGKLLCLRTLGIKISSESYAHSKNIVFFQGLQVFSYTLYAVYTIYSNVMHMHCLTMQRDQGRSV
jgi:hypothetical protein